MKSYFLVLLAIASCCAFGIGGYAAGAYMQFAQTLLTKQDIFVREIITAQGIAKNQDSKLLEWMRADIPLQYRFLSSFEEIRNASLPIRLSAVTRMTWSNWSMASNGILSSARWQQMIRKCECGVALPDAKP